jgi:hypothetical protein
MFLLPKKNENESLISYPRKLKDLKIAHNSSVSPSNPATTEDIKRTACESFAEPDISSFFNFNQKKNFC